MPKIKTALLSFGMSGKVFHAPFIHLNPGFELLGAWERSKKVIGHAYPGVKSYATMEELLADDADLVVVNTPSNTHYTYAKAALLAGKHVIVEKPFTTTTAEGEELKALALEKGRLIFPYQNRRYDSDFLTVKRILEEDILGNIVEAEIRYDRFNEALSPKAHKERPGPGAGIVYDLAPHLTDQALQLFGLPRAVFADIMITRPASRVADYFEILMYYPQMRVRLKSGYFIREPLPGFIIYGTKGSFLKNRTDVQETDLQAGKTPGTAEWGMEPESERGLLHTEKEGKAIREKVPTEKGDYMKFYTAVQGSLAQGKAFPITVDQAIDTIRIIEAAFKSSEEGRVVELAG